MWTHKAAKICVDEWTPTVRKYNQEWPNVTMAEKLNKDK